MPRPSDFGRAIEERDFGAARTIAKASDLDLVEALQLTVLAADEEPQMYSPLARRWLARFVCEAAPRPSDLQQAARALGRLREGRASAAQVVATVQPIVAGVHKRGPFIPMRSSVGVPLATRAVTVPRA
jgi:hypothetical protein